ncbi:HNH endonuclease [Pseudomonadaceae bacterium T75]|nr:HNH endonuclease [Pseudomonadaceae bacterium T75]
MDLSTDIHPQEIKVAFSNEHCGKELPSLDELNKPIEPYSPDSYSTTLDISTLNSPIELPTKVEAVRLPMNGGEWNGEVGNSDWIPDDTLVPKQPIGNELSWREIKDKYGIESIPFIDGEPDFSAVSEATVEIDDFTTDRNSNFTQADEACAEKWNAEQKDGRNWTAADVKEYRKENQLSWHERSDQKTMDLVPQEVHGNVPHSGGISAAKNGEN